MYVEYNTLGLGGCYGSESLMLLKLSFKRDTSHWRDENKPQRWLRHVPHLTLGVSSAGTKKDLASEFIC